MSRDAAHPDLEVLARLELPLPLDLAVEIMQAIVKAAERRGYTNAVILTDAPGQRIAATPPPPGWTPPDDDPDDDWDDDEDEDDGQQQLPLTPDDEETDTR